MNSRNFLTYLFIALFVISALFTACKPDEENGNTEILVKTITCYGYGKEDEVRKTIRDMYQNYYS